MSIASPSKMAAKFVRFKFVSRLQIFRTTFPSDRKIPACRKNGLKGGEGAILVNRAAFRGGLKSRRDAKPKRRLEANARAQARAH